MMDVGITHVHCLLAKFDISNGRGKENDIKTEKN
jgi:hypothetical protein